MTVKDFVNKYTLLAVECATQRGLLPCVAFTCLSQCALETGWLNSDLMRNNNAPFGIKWYEGCGFDYYETPSKEYKNGQYVTVMARFKKYDNIYDAFNDYYNLLANGRYKDCLTATTVKECITIIYQKGYATDPDYISKIMAVFHTIVKVIGE